MKITLGRFINHETNQVALATVSSVLPATVKDILLGGGIMALGAIYLAVKSFNYGVIRSGIAVTEAAEETGELEKHEDKSNKDSSETI